MEVLNELNNIIENNSQFIALHQQHCKRLLESGIGRQTLQPEFQRSMRQRRHCFGSVTN